MKTYYEDVREALKHVYESDYNGSRGMKSKSADRVIVTLGYEGTGKSNFALIALDKWYKHINKPMTPQQLAKQISAKPQEFARAIKESQEYDHIVIDEGVLLSYGRNAMSDVSKHINTLLMVCRAKKFYINILIPNFLDLDTYIRKNRVTALWVMLSGYRVAYFSKRRVRKLLIKMAYTNRGGGHADPMKQGIYPNFVAKVPLCDNTELVEEYGKIKQANMSAVIESTAEAILGAKDQTNVKKNKPDMEKAYYDQVLKLRKEGMNKHQIRKELAISLETINQILVKDLAFKANKEKGTV